MCQIIFLERGSTYSTVQVCVVMATECRLVILSLWATLPRTVWYAYGQGNYQNRFYALIISLAIIYRLYCPKTGSSTLDVQHGSISQESLSLSKASLWCTRGKLLMLVADADRWTRGCLVNRKAPAQLPIRHYLEYHTVRQIIVGAVCGAAFGLLWYWVAEVSCRRAGLHSWFISQKVCQMLYLHDSRDVPNILRLEYETVGRHGQPNCNGAIKTATRSKKSHWWAATKTSVNIE